ncbi:MAG: hypothetical protein AAF799_21935 [Myxococcota bacterium]
MAPLPAPPPEPTADVQAEPAPQPPPVEATPTPPPPPPALVFVGDGWVRDPDDPQAPLIRLIRLDPASEDPPTATQALLDGLEPLMECYEAVLQTNPDWRFTLSLHRDEPREPGDDDLGLFVRPEAPGFEVCARLSFQQVLPKLADDPHGRYAMRAYPRRSDAPRLRMPRAEDEVTQRHGGSCWTYENYPCAPKKRCKAPEWVRSQCHHPAERPGVALRWALQPVDRGRQAIVGLELVGTDDEVVWTVPLDADDAERMGNLARDDAQRHLDHFRDRRLPGSLWVELRPTAIVVADRAGVRAMDRRSGRVVFRYAAPPPPESKFWFDGGTYVARRGSRRCEGDAGHGAFAALCGPDLLYFDGHTFAVIETESGFSVRGETSQPQHRGNAPGSGVRPVAAYRAARVRLDLEGIIYLE